MIRLLATSAAVVILGLILRLLVVTSQRDTARRTRDALQAQIEAAQAERAAIEARLHVAQGERQRIAARTTQLLQRLHGSEPRTDEDARIWAIAAGREIAP